MIPFLLVSLGILFIFFEFYLPGGIMALLGAIAIFSGIILFANETSSIFLLLLFMAGIAIGIVLVIRFALWKIVRTKPEYSIYSNQDQEGYVASAFDSTAIGKIGIVLSDLKPGGFILINDKQHSALSISGYISKGKEVVVIGGQEQSLMVKLHKKESL